MVTQFPVHALVFVMQPLKGTSWLVLNTSVLVVYLSSGLKALYIHVVIIGEYCNVCVCNIFYVLYTFIYYKPFCQESKYKMLLVL